MLGSRNEIRRREISAKAGENRKEEALLEFHILSDPVVSGRWENVNPL